MAHQDIDSYQFPMFVKFILSTVICLLSCFNTGCKQSTQPQVETIVDPLPACIDYTKDPKGYAYCVYQQATSLTDIASVEKYCNQAKEWIEPCRQAWAVSKVDSVALEDLMHICDQNNDCALEVLDSKPHEDVLQQIKLCAQYAGRYSADCAMHASQRWYFDWPEADEIARVAKKKSPFPDHVGWYVAARVGCDNVGSCQGEQRIQKICEKNLEIFTNKRNCPNQHRNRKKRKTTK